MKKYILLLFVAIVAFTVNDVQKDFIILNWNEFNSENPNPKDIAQLSFNNAGFDASKNNLPVFSKLYPINKQHQQFRVSIQKEKYTELTRLPDNFNSEIITEKVDFKTSVLKSGNKAQVQISFIPIIKKEGKIWLLKSFELNRIPLKSATKNSSQIAWQSQSVLKSGKWIKIATHGKGIYKIPYSKLSEWGFPNPANVSVFGAGGVLQSENPGIIEYDDLPQNAVWHASNGGENCLFFYAAGEIKWEADELTQTFTHTKNEYTNKGYYFLSESATTKNPDVLTEPQEDANVEVQNSNEYAIYELDQYNLLSSGKQWFGDKFINNSSKKFIIDLPDADKSIKAKVRINTAARSSQSSKMKVSINNAGLETIDFFKVNTGDPTTMYADERDKNYLLNLQDNKVDVSLTYQASNENAEAWLDYIEVNYKRNLIAGSVPVFFRNLNSVGENNIAEYTISNATSNTKVFDLADGFNLAEVPVHISGSTLTFKQNSRVLHEYVTFKSDGNFDVPELIGEVENQNLHGLNTPELLIVSHANYMESANALANFHSTYDNMDVEVVQADKVFNEFSSGSASATGIRNFIKMFYDRNNGLKYVLLFGDGSFDNKNLNTNSNNFIPTYQSQNSLNPVASFVTDDYFVMLDAGESVYNGAVDLGIGRIPASSVFEAQVAVDKVLNYYSPQALGNWRNIVCFIADDEDGGLHLSDSEKLASQVNTNHKEFVTDKIYFDSYQQESVAGVERYPGVTDAIDKRVKEGVLVLNYVGHANERFMADEHVLDVSNINSWSNTNNLPIFVTATCEFSRFDGEHESAGEYILFNPNGGGIGLFSTTRVVFAYSNFLLSRSFYNYVFAKDETGEHYRMGDIMRLAKTNTINTTNKRNFSLLADPALRLSYPKYRVVTSTINQKDATAVTDTIASLQKITITGYISDYKNNKLGNFNGEIFPTVFDKEITMKTLGNGGEVPMSFKVQENIIYKGVASVKNGEFTFSFVVPKDISYNLGAGKVIYYASNNETDAHGAFNNFFIGGTSNSQITDNQGPDIQLFIDTEEFQSGGTTSKNPTLLAYLSDENGINTVGTGIGHDITAVLDDDFSNVFVLNNFYQADIDNYTSGKIEFPLKNLSVGTHKLRLKAWDVAGNSSEVEIDFLVSGEFFINKISNYPNPVNDYTFFTFEHNQSDSNLDAIFEIFDQQGKRIDIFTAEVGSNGTSSNPVRWDLAESKITLKSGIYIYRVIAQNSDGIIASKSGKMIIAR